MTSVQILSETRRHGIELKAVGDRLLFRPAQDVPAELLSAIRAYKTELLELLSPPEDHDTPGVVPMDKLKEAEAGFSCLDAAPLDVVLCVADPDRRDGWVAYRRTNRHQQGRGDSQATAVLALGRAEDDAGRQSQNNE